MGQEFGRFDPPDRVFDQTTELLALLVGDGGAEVLNLNQPLADEDDLGDLGNACHPGIANQLWVEGQQATRFLGVAAGGGLPLEQRTHAIQVPDSIDVGHEVIGFRDRSGELDLQVAPGLANPDAVVLAETLQQLNPLLQHPVPGIAFGILQTLVLTGRPLTKQDGGRVFAEEVGRQGLFEGSAEEHGGPGILLPPAVKVAMSIATRAGEVLADLGVAVTLKWERSKGLNNLEAAGDAQNHVNRRF